MPASWDWTRWVERLRQREPTLDARLKQRLANLSPAHPSSPNRPDRSPGLDSAELSDGELTSANDDVADQPAKSSHSDASYVSPDGSWEWKGMKLTAEQNREAERAVARYRALEGRGPDGEYGGHGLTPAMRRIEAEVGGTLVGCPEFTLKTADRFREKLVKMITLEPDRSAAELTTQIHDAIRYTFVFDSSDYTDFVLRTVGKLRDSGYDMAGIKLGWQGAEYKGINSRWREPTSGLLFEVQFHTAQSWDAKQRTHDAYVQIGTPGTPPDERDRLRAYQMRITASVKVPDGADEIGRYLEEGR
jgi:hypothetical protein